MDTELQQKWCVPCTNACKTEVLSSQRPPRYVISVWNSHRINLSFSLLKFPVRLCSDDDNNDDDFKWLMYSTVRWFYVYQLQVKPIVISSFGNTSSLFNMSRFIHLIQELSSPSVTHTGGFVFFRCHLCLTLCKSQCPYVHSHDLIITCRVTNVVCICHSLSVFYFSAFLCLPAGLLWKLSIFLPLLGRTIYFNVKHWQ